MSVNNDSLNLATSPDVAKEAAQTLLNIAANTGAADEQYAATLNSLITLYNTGKVTSLVPMLPLLLKLKGHPYSLHNHFPMEPLFSLTLPRSFVFKAGRQVSKSTTLAAQGIVQAATIPFFSSLYVAPRFEQTRRFSTNYVKPFLTDTPLGNSMVESQAEQSVLQRTFKNGSALHFSYAFLDANRIRGYAADQVKYDECLSKNIDIFLPSGYTILEQCKPGDSILGFNNDGKIVEDKIVAIVPKGYRHVYRLTLENGAAIECTDNEKLFTDRGWKYMEEILNAKDTRHECTREPTTNTATRVTSTGNTARRRKHGVAWCNIRQILHYAWRKTRSILSPQSGSTCKLCKHTTQAAPKQGLGADKLRVLNNNLPSIRIYTAPVLPPRLLSKTPKNEQKNTASLLQQTHNQSVAQTPDMGGPGLLVHGRRDTCQRSTHCIQHPQLHRGRSGSSSRKPNTSRCCCNKTPRNTSQTQLLYSCVESGCKCFVHRTHEKVCTRKHDVQVHTGTARNDDLRSVRQINTSTSQESARMWKQGLSSHCTPRSQTEIPQHQPRQNKRTVSQALSQQPYRESKEISNCCSKEIRKSGVSSTIQHQETRTACQETLGESKTHRDGNVPILRQTDTPQKPQEINHDCVCRSRMQISKESHQSTNVGKEKTFGELVGSRIASIEYLGVDEVFDIETEKHHTLFAGGVAVHNCQDLDTDFIPIIDETLSASNYALRQFTGTPKTLDNTLEGLWEQSSQAEWLIPCGCGHWNIASVHHDLLKMIQKDGLSCAKCTALIDSSTGHWEHRYPDLRPIFAGYHVPQPIMPMHYEIDPATGRKDKWTLLWNSKHNMDKAKFLNEKLGESCDVRVTLVSRTDLQRASTLTHDNNFRAALKTCGKYVTRTMGVDWGGGGVKGLSHTAFAIVGHLPNGSSDVIFGGRLVNASDPAEEAAILLRYFRAFNCTLLAHDFGGSGSIRETLLIQAGLPVQQIFPAIYVRASAAAMITYKPPQGNYARWWYSVDKARSLVLICQLIRHGLLRFPKFDSWEDLSEDFLALVEDKREMPRGPDIYLVTRKANKADDFAHAVNYACLAQWHSTQKYPNLANQVGLRLTQDQIADIIPPDPMSLL